MPEWINVTHPPVMKDHSNILESWFKFQMMPYADFNVCWFQLCTHIQIVPICRLNVWVAKSPTRGDEWRTGRACIFSVQPSQKKKKKSLGLPVCFHLSGLEPGHTLVFSEDVPVQPICRPVICFEFVLSQLDLHLPPSKVVFPGCIFRWLDSWWMLFQEFLPSVGCRPLLQPSSTLHCSRFPHRQVHSRM